MSVEQILKNVYTFLDILQTVLIGDLHDWNKDLIFDALKWAKYCQQVIRVNRQTVFEGEPVGGMNEGEPTGSVKEGEPTGSVNEGELMGCMNEGV